MGSPTLLLGLQLTLLHHHQAAITTKLYCNMISQQIVSSKGLILVSPVVPVFALIAKIMDQLLLLPPVEKVTNSLKAQLVKPQDRFVPGNEIIISR